MRTSYRNVLLVAPDVFPIQSSFDYKKLKHVSSFQLIFPTIFELNPDLIVFDHNFMGGELEKVLRRIQINKFYNKTKIFCYKDDPHTRTDGLLKALGVDQFIYREDLLKLAKSKTPANKVTTIFDTSIFKLAGNISN